MTPTVLMPLVAPADTLRAYDLVDIATFRWPTRPDAAGVGDATGRYVIAHRTLLDVGWRWARGLAAGPRATTSAWLPTCIGATALDPPRPMSSLVAHPAA